MTTYFQDEPPFEQKCKCEKCGSDAIHESWEAVEGGAVNPYYAIICQNTDCDHEDTNYFPEDGSIDYDQEFEEEAA